jgi:hypothetical protein
MDRRARSRILLGAAIAAISLPAGVAAAQFAASSLLPRGPSLKLFYRAHTDVDGDGRADSVTLTRGSISTPGRVDVRLASGRRVSVRIATDAVYLPGLVKVGNVNGRPGAELFIDRDHVTTAEAIGIYTYWRGQLRRAGTLSAYGSDYGIRFGITCGARGSTHLVFEHQFWLRTFSPPRWRQRDTVYLWSGPALRLVRRGAARSITGAPPARLLGVGCGHVPSR